MARYVGNIDLFFRKDNLEAYQTSNENVIRRLRQGNIYLGEGIDPCKETDIEEVRLQRAVSLLQKSGGRLLKQNSEKAVGQRLKKLLRGVFGFDQNHFPGNRSIHTGLLASEGRALLLGFDFNPHSRPGEMLGNAVKLDLKNGTLCLSDFSPALLLSKTPRTSRLKVRLLLSRVDFLSGEYMTYMSKEEVLTAADPVRDVHLKIGQCPEGDGYLFAYLWLGFERDDAVAVPELLWYVDDVFRVVGCL